MRKEKTKPISGDLQKAEKSSKDRSSDSSGLKTYLRQIKGYPLLTREQEREKFQSLEKEQREFKKALAQFQSYLQSRVNGEKENQILRAQLAFVKAELAYIKMIIATRGKGTEHKRGHGEEESAHKQLAVAREKFGEALRNFSEHKEDKSAFRTAVDSIRQQMLSQQQSIANANLRLVIKLAKSYEDRGLSFLDLIQNGNAGLMKAIDKMDYRLNCKFSTVATQWIKQAISMGLSVQARAIRLPRNIFSLLGTIKPAKALLTESLGRVPTEEEVAAYTKKDLKKVRAAMESDRRCLNFNYSAGGKAEGFLEGKIAEKFCQVSGNESSSEDLDKILSTLLDPREFIIIKRNILSSGEDSMSLEQLGKSFFISKAHAGQIKDGALEKLRRAINGGYLDAAEDCWHLTA